MKTGVKSVSRFENDASRYAAYLDTPEGRLRAIADYLPALISRSAEYERIFGLERKLGKRREFFGVARYMHCLASCATLGSEGDE
jgi:hypothetical protein